MVSIFNKLFNRVKIKQFIMNYGEKSKGIIISFFYYKYICLFFNSYIYAYKKKLQIEMNWVKEKCFKVWKKYYMKKRRERHIISTIQNHHNIVLKSMIFNEWCDYTIKVLFLRNKEIENKIASSPDKIKELESNHDDLYNKMEKLSFELVNMKNTNINLESSLIKKQNILKEHEKKKNELNSQFQSKNDTLNSLQSHNCEQQAEIELLIKEIEQYKLIITNNKKDGINSLDTYHNEIEKQKKDNEIIIELIEQYKLKYKEEKQKIDGKMEEYKKNIISCMNLVKEKENIKNKLEIEIKPLNEELSKTISKLNEFNKSADKLRNESNKGINESQKYVEQLEERLNSLNKKINDLNNLINTQNLEISHLKLMLNQIEIKNKHIKK